MNVKNPWVKKKIAQVYVFHQGQLVLTIRTPAQKIILSGKHIEVHYEQTPPHHFTNICTTWQFQMNIAVFSGDELLEEWLLPAVEWKGGSHTNQSGKNFGLYCFSSDFTHTIDSQYIG